MVLVDPRERITATEVLNICENTKCEKCGQYKESTCYLKGFSNCSCNELICKDCLEARMEDTISTMNSKSIIKCSKCSNPFSESDIRKIVDPKTFETYTKIKNPPIIIQRPQVTIPQPSTSTRPQPQVTIPQPQQPQRAERNTGNYSINTIKHENVICDGCREKDFTGIRWKCLSCPSYDLCNSCYPRRNNTVHRNHRFAKMEIFNSSFEDDIQVAYVKMIISDHRGAIESLDNALSEYPLCERALILKATCKEKLELYKDAKDLCDKILNECNSYSVKACEILGRIYLKHNNSQMAITYLEKAVSIASDYEICQYFLAVAYQKDKKYGNALNHARISFKLNSDEANTKLLGELLIQNEEWAEGKLMLSLAHTKDPTNAEFLYFLGLCEENTGDFVESLKSFRAAMSRDPFEIKYKISADRVSELLDIC